MELSLRVTGFEPLYRRYTSAPQIIMQNLSPAVTRIVIFGEKLAKQLVAKDTRNLARSITHRVESGVGRVRGVWGTSVFYGPYVEKGTRPHFPPPGALAGWARRHDTDPWAVAKGIAKNGTKAQPFMKPSFDQTRPKAMQELRTAAQRAFRQIGGAA